MRLPIIVALFLLLAPPAQADPIADARARFRAAEALKGAGHYDEAIAAYQEAYQLAASPELFFNVALCYKLKGDRVRAIEVFKTYLELNPTGIGAPRAREHIELLERELMTERPPPPPAAAVAPPLAPAAAPPPARARARARGGRALRVAGIIGLAAGGLALAAGGYEQARASSIRGELGDLERWDPGLYARGRAAQRDATILLGAGAAVAVTGGVLLVLGLRASATVEPGAALVTVAGTF